MSAPSERRRLQRVKLSEPLPGRIGPQRVYIIDVSRDGVRVAHQESVGEHGQRNTIEFDWDGRHVALDCRLTYSELQRRNVFYSGFAIVSTPNGSESTLRELIAWHVERALDEQKANARGIPAMAANSFQTGRARDFVRHVFSAGRWHEVQTTDTKQPMSGFTLGSDQTAREVAMLRGAWESGDAAARHVIQKMAELSISRVEGIPTRRYMP